MFSDKKPSPSQTALSFRLPMQVTHIRRLGGAHNNVDYPICPRCRCTMDREYQAYCDRCGQCLSWKGFRRAALISG